MPTPVSTPAVTPKPSRVPTPEPAGRTPLARLLKALTPRQTDQTDHATRRFATGLRADLPVTRDEACLRTSF